MVKRVFPQTILHPLQNVIFILKEHDPVRAQLTMQPDSSRECVHHVELDLMFLKTSIHVPFTNPGKTRGIDQAALDAYKMAQKNANDWGTIISEVWLEGEEFLELNDIRNMVGCDVTVKLI